MHSCSKTERVGLGWTTEGTECPDLELTVAHPLKISEQTKRSNKSSVLE